MIVEILEDEESTGLLDDETVEDAAASKAGALERDAPRASDVESAAAVACETLFHDVVEAVAQEVSAYARRIEHGEPHVDAARSGRQTLLSRC